jgi:group II intron reverse transcriptase/maturase
MQLELNFETADKGAKQAPCEGAKAGHLRSARALPQQKTKLNERKAKAATMEEVIDGLGQAFEAVAANRGAPGPDRQGIEQVREHLQETLSNVGQALLQGSYKPGEIRRVWIPKAGGGQRGLGIPNVIDRVVQEALRRVLEPVYEPTFHPSSHGFRPQRSCHTAIDQAKKYVQEVREWVVDIDLENFFNAVNHQRLMSRLALRVNDKRLLELIWQMLKARVVMPDGVVVSNEEGVPQGGPLSPLLSNVVLDELDWKLEERGLKFVRYADDANIYVKSERAGIRVMESVTRFIEGRLRLKVNTKKSAVAQPQERHFLGFSLGRKPRDGTVEVALSKRSKERIDSKVRELTPRNWGGSIKSIILGLNLYTSGWMGFFGICTEEVESTLGWMNAHIRRRLRAMELKQYKRKRTIVKKLIQRGIRAKTAWRHVTQGRKSIWALSHTWAVERALSNSLWEERGLKTLTQRYRAHPRRMVAQEPVQSVLVFG